MSCLFKVKPVKEILSTMGGVSIPSYIVFTREELEKMKDYLDNSKFSIENPMDLHDIYNQDKTFNTDFMLSLLINNEKKGTVMSTVLSMGNIADINKDTMAHIFVKYGYKFTMDEILILGNPRNWMDDTIGELMAWNHHSFTIDELIKLKNEDESNATLIAEIMIQHGSSFSDDEKEILGIE